MNKHVRAIAVLLFLVLAFLLKDLVSRNTAFAPLDSIYMYSPWNESTTVIPKNFQQSDALYQFIPWRMYAYEQLIHGEFPLWNPYEYGGIPFFANDQSGVLSPYNLAGLIFPFLKGFLIMALLKLLVAATGMYLFLSLFSLDPASCLIGSVAYTFSALMVTWLYHPLSAVLSFIPWLLWAFERLYRYTISGTAANRITALSIASAIVALAFFSGHSETTVNALAGVMIYSITKSLAGRQKILHTLLMAALAVILGFLLAAAQTLPFLQALLNSVTFYTRSPFFATIHLPAWALLSWLVPSMNGNPSFSYFFMKVIPAWHEAVSYVGITPLLLGLITLARLKLDYKRLLPFWVMIVFGLGIAYGMPGMRWLALLPVIRAGGAFRYLILAECGVSALSAFGLDLLIRRLPASAVRRSLKAVFILVIVCAAAGAVYWITRFSSPLSTPVFNGLQILLSALFITAAGWFILGTYRGRLQGRTAAAGLIVLSVTDLFVFGIGYNPDVPNRDFYPNTPIIHALKTMDTKDYSMYASDSIMPPDTAMVYHLRDFRGYDMIASFQYQRFLYLLFPHEHADIGSSGLTIWPDRPSPVIAGIAGIRYFVFPRGLDPNGQGTFFTLTGTYKNLSLWQNPLALPVYYLAQGVIPAQNGSTALHLLAHATPGNLRVPVVQGIGIEHRYTPAQIRLRETLRRPGEYGFHVQALARGFMVLNEPRYPGWHAYRNNTPVPIYPANYLFQGIELPKGHYTIRFSYQPRMFRAGLIISITTLFLLIFFAVGSYVLSCRHVRQ